MLAVHAAASAAGVRYSVAGVSASDIAVTVTVIRGPRETPASAPAYFAFQTLPGVSWKAGLAFRAAGSSVSVPVGAGAAGWAGNRYLQWITWSAGGNLDKRYGDTLRGELTITAATPLFRGFTATQLGITGNILTAPLSPGAAPAKTGAAAPFRPLPFRQGLKIEIAADGLYEISGNALAAAGVPIASIVSRTYRLHEKNDEVPLHCTAAPSSPLGAGDRLLFFGKSLHGGGGQWFTQYSLTNVYWLSWDGQSPGTRVAVVSGRRRVNEMQYSPSGIDLTAHDFRDTLHLEFDNGMVWLGDVQAPIEMTGEAIGDTALDYWYWGYIGASELTNYAIMVPAPARTGTARLRIAFMGVTTVENNPSDHQVTVLINGNPAGLRNTAEWDGQTPFVFQSDTFSVSRLSSGRNEISFIVKNRGFVDRCALNWIEIDYPRTYRALNDTALFRSADNAVNRTVEFQIAGFSTPAIDLWDIGTYRLFTGFETRPGTGNDRSLTTLVFQDSVTMPTRYRASALSARRTPFRMSLDTVPSGLAAFAGTDYLAVGPSWARAVVSPLLAAHEREGLRTAFVDIKDIFNYFSSGVQDPESIRSFMRALAALAPSRPPRYLLLAGDCTSSLYKAFAARTTVPTHLTRIPGWGAAADDDYFVTLGDDDLFCDAAVGRFPAETPEQLRTMVDKTVNYILRPTRGFWRDNLLMASGAEREFTDFTDKLAAEVVGPRLTVLRMDADPASPWYKDELTASAGMASFINAGVFAVNFNGHGGGNIWSDSRFFGYEDIDKLHNDRWPPSGRLPVVFSFTCLTGFFESSDYRSLGEEMVRSSRAGAVCFYGASALTAKKGNMLLNRLLLDFALDGSVTTVGGLVRLCETNLLARNGAPYLPLCREYNLLGDPALPWRLTPDTLRLALGRQALVATDSLKVGGTCLPVKNGSVSLQVAAGATLWGRSIDDVRNGSFSRSFDIKDSAKTAAGMVRAYAWNDSCEVRGWAAFSKDTIMVRNVRISPPSPAFGDSVSVSCEIDVPPRSENALVYCLWAIAAPNAASRPMTGMPMIPDSAGRFRTNGKIRCAFTGDINQELLVSFRVQTGSLSKESGLTAFPIAGRPDLIVTDRQIPVIWTGDSLRATLQVLNQGTAPAPAFDLTLFWGAPPGGAPAGAVMCPGLEAGKAGTVSLTVPDTQGTLSLYALVNAKNAFPEITLNNNGVSGALSIAAGTLAAPSDTLRSPGGGLLLVPAAKLSAARKVFLLQGAGLPAFPLATESRWLTLRGDSIRSFSMGSRPPMAATDSLRWLWLATDLPAGFTAGVTQTAAGKLAIMVYDSAISAWRYAGGAGNAAPEYLLLTSATGGPYAAAFLADVKPPDVRVSVYGRELNALDYAARDQPFVVQMADPSGIDPASVSLQLNRSPLAKELVSAVPLQNGGAVQTVLTLTAYPPPQNAVDSLSVTAADLAGNRRTAFFAYLHGENLTVKFLTCHPNPFSLRERGVNGPPQKVRFAFLLTDNAAEATLSVHTVTGRQIWSSRHANLIGYQEIEWNGRDFQGFRIGNGTYYAKLAAKNGQKSVTKIIRIAKLEGY